MYNVSAALANFELEFMFAPGHRSGPISSHCHTVGEVELCLEAGS